MKSCYLIQFFHDLSRFLELGWSKEIAVSRHSLCFIMPDLCFFELAVPFSQLIGRTGNCAAVILSGHATMDFCVDLHLFSLVPKIEVEKYFIIM